jgi:hypothetical protein
MGIMREIMCQTGAKIRVGRQAHNKPANTCAARLSCVADSEVEKIASRVHIT